MIFGSRREPAIIRCFRERNSHNCHQGGCPCRGTGAGTCEAALLAMALECWRERSLAEFHQRWEPRHQGTAGDGRLVGTAPAAGVQGLRVRVLADSGDLAIAEPAARPGSPPLANPWLRHPCSAPRRRFQGRGRSRPSSPPSGHPAEQACVTASGQAQCCTVQRRSFDSSQSFGSLDGFPDAQLTAVHGPG